MNWIDFVVLAIIVGFGIYGMMNGFIYSIFKLASFFVSAIIAVKFYGVVANLLMKTALYTNIKSSILKNLIHQHAAGAPKAGASAKKAAADTVINNLKLPDFLKDSLIKKMPNPSKLVDVNSLLDTISGHLARMVIDVISLVLLYVLIRIALIFLKFILKGVAKLPVFKQMDKLGGFSFGAVEGLLTIYILCAVLMLFHSNTSFNWLFTAIDHSSITKFFYENNFIVSWMGIF